MSNYTEADVETDVAGLEGTINNSGYVEEIQALDRKSLARLKAAALEGAKVPGLEQKVSDLQQKVCDWQAASGLETGSGDPDGIEPHHLEADLRKRDAEVSALHARMAELERERDERDAELDEWEKAVGDRQERDTGAIIPATPNDLRRLLESMAGDTGVALAERDEARAERDALRAEAQGALDSLSQPKTFPGDVDLARRILKTALSAPPAETTPAPERTERKHTPVRYAPDTEDRRRPSNDDDE